MIPKQRIKKSKNLQWVCSDMLKDCVMSYLKEIKGTGLRNLRLNAIHVHLAKWTIITDAERALTHDREGEGEGGEVK